MRYFFFIFKLVFLLVLLDILIITHCVVS